MPFPTNPPGLRTGYDDCSHQPRLLPRLKALAFAAALAGILITLFFKGHLVFNP